jgi:hypothetical protein
MKRIKMGKYLFNNVIKIKISLYFKLKSCSLFETFPGIFHVAKVGKYLF